MKKIWKGLLFMGFLAFLFGIFGCKKPGGKPDDFGGLEGNPGLGEKAAENGSGLTEFAYSYYGSIGGDSYSLTVRTGNPDAVDDVEAGEEPGIPEDPEKLYFIYTNMLHEEYGTMKKEVSPEILQDLKALYEKHRICRWEDFDMVAMDVLDGDGFSLRLKFEDGKKLSASGSNAYPEGYSEFKKEMNEFFSPLTEELLEAGRQEKISAGMKGNVSSYMIHFKERGASGRDDYNFFLCQRESRENNVSIDITSDSGEFLPQGSYHLYGAADEKLLKFEELQELVEKYDLIQWYNYDETAEDYNNSEWFQISIGTDERFYLNAYGTEHPKNYEEFRKEFLQMMAEMVTELQKLPEFSEE